MEKRGDIGGFVVLRLYTVPGRVVHKTLTRSFGNRRQSRHKSAKIETVPALLHDGGMLYLLHPHHSVPVESDRAFPVQLAARNVQGDGHVRVLRADRLQI